MITAGSNFGPYEIDTRLGAGGMGEVYRARDTRLGRTVAIKVLASRVSGDETARRRFAREARAISSLNHPHICALYDVGQENGHEYLVMEYLDGETLAERLVAGPLPADEALRYAVQIAGALERAHRQGVVHRDFKPGNIMLTKSGAKLLDFGVARTLDASHSTAGPLTEDDALIGTVDYMAPEQLRGETVDARSDIFAFGVVLYEMLAGARPFTGHNRASVIGAILFATPDPAAGSRAGLAASLDRLIAACLEKDPENRIQTARDLRRELEWALEGSGEHRTMPNPRRRRLIQRVAAIVVALGVVAGLGIAGGRWMRPAPARDIHFTLAPPVKGDEIDWPVISPDGTKVAFISQSPEGKGALVIRSVGSEVGRVIPGTDMVSQPFWSPGSDALAFFAGERLRVLPLAAQSAQLLVPASAPRGGSWGKNGAILYVPHISTGIWLTSALGATPREVTSISERDRDVSHRWPEFLPDGRRFLFIIQSRDAERSGLYLGSVDNPGIRKVANVRSRTVVDPTGSILYIMHGRLYRQGFDLSSAEVRGSPSVVAENVNVDLKLTGGSAISVARDGSHTWLSKRDARTQLAWADRSGKRLETIAGPGFYVNPALSPDESTLAVSIIDEETGRNSISLINMRTSSVTPFVNDDANADGPAWDPTGTRIAYASDRAGKYEVYERAVGGVGRDRVLFRGQEYAAPIIWRKSALILYSVGPDGSIGSIWLWPPGAAAPRRFLENSQGTADISPDGRWILLVRHSSETGRFEVSIRSVDDASMDRQITIGGGTQPIWRADGREFYYIDADRRLMATSFENGEFGAPMPLFELPIDRFFYSNGYYLPSRDGERFLLNLPVAPEDTSVANIVIRAR